MAGSVDYTEIYAALEQARQKEKAKRVEKLRRQLEELVNSRRSADEQLQSGLQSTAAQEAKAQRSLQENTAGKGLLRSGYMDRLLERQKTDSGEAYNAVRTAYEKKVADVNGSKQALEEKAQDDLTAIDAKYDNKTVAAREKEQAQRLSLEKAALAAAAKAAAAAAKTSGGKTDNTAATADPNHIYTDAEIAALTKKYGVRKDFIDYQLARAVRSGNVRAFFEENSGPIIREAGEELWNALMQRYKELEKWYRESGKGSIA